MPTAQTALRVPPEPAAPDFRPALRRVASRTPLSATEAEEIFGAVMEGAATTPQIAALLMALHVRGETVPELTGLVRAMRSRMTAIAAPTGAIDVCGTGGDGTGTLNVSTAVSFVVAGAGVPVAKHGNRALSSRSGAADVLEALGITLDVPYALLPELLLSARCAFLFAPRHHAALRHAAEARRDLGIRTIFNLAGPLANPALVRRQLTGVYDPVWAAPMARALHDLGTQKAWLVHGMGLDELTLAGESHVVELEEGRIRAFTVTPGDAGLSPAPLSAIQGGDAAFNATALTGLLNNGPGPYRDTVILNAAAALVVADRAGDLREAAALAAHSIESGAARAAFESLRRASQPADTTH